MLQSRASSDRVRPFGNESRQWQHRSTIKWSTSMNSIADLSAEKLANSLTEVVHSGNQPPLLSSIPRLGGWVKTIYKLIFYRVMLIDSYVDQNGRLQKQNL